MANKVASAVTDKEPANKARIPYWGRTSDEGCQLGLVKNSTRFKPPNNSGAASRKTKKKMAITKKVALQPQILIIHSTSGSARFRTTRMSRAREKGFLYDLWLKTALHRMFTLRENTLA